MRSFVAERTTTETAVRVEARLDDASDGGIRTGLAIFDHFLNQLAFHGGFRLDVDARSLDGIRHHLIEDVALAIGNALDGALGDRRGIARYACVTLPMDDALVRVAVDLGKRSYSRVDLPLASETIEGLEAALVRHFFCSLAASASLCAHVDVLAGNDPHHAAEAAFKAFGRACRAAWTLDSTQRVPSTKGSL